VLDAANVDLKAFDEDFYRRVSDASLRPVLDALVTLREEGVWLEVTNLLIPTLNDDLAMIRRMVRWLRDELGEGTPLHFSRFQPQYRMRNLPPTPAEALDRARHEALDGGLKYVYIGNIPGHEGGSTYCHRRHPADRAHRVLDHGEQADGGWPLSYVRREDTRGLGMRPLTVNSLRLTGRGVTCNEEASGVRYEKRYAARWDRACAAASGAPAFSGFVERNGGGRPGAALSERGEGAARARSEGGGLLPSPRPGRMSAAG